MNKEIHFIHQCSVADDDADDADAARNEAIVKGSHRGASESSRMEIVSGQNEESFC